MIDIYSKAEYPSCELSNFAEHHFIYDSVRCNSIEGFLQSLKYKSIKKQAEVCLKIGSDAKEAGAKKRLWKVTKRVYWKGKCIGLFSDELQELIDGAYLACFEQCEKFRNALAATENEKLIHRIGKTDSRKTILTEYNFIRRLNILRIKEYGEE